MFLLPLLARLLRRRSQPGIGTVLAFFEPSTDGAIHAMFIGPGPNRVGNAGWSFTKEEI